MLGLNLLCLKRRRKAWSPPPARLQHPAPPRVKTPRSNSSCSSQAKPHRDGAGRHMAPTPPLPVTEDTPPDMLAGSMDLRVVLPNGHAVKMSVERGTPMMDLLVQVATANKIPPGGHVIQAVGERGLLPYKPSTPIGALDTWTIQIVPKARVIPSAGFKKAPHKPSNQQPFEQTFRLQVHLPRNQLFVARVSPKTVLSDVLALACSEKNLDPSKYELRHPANLEERLRSDWTLADYKLQEVTMVAKGGRPLGAGLSSSDIMALQKEEEKRRQQTRAGGGTGSAVLGLMFNKRSRSSVCDGSISSDSLGGRSISPVRSDGTPSPPGSSLPPPRPTRKRRPAPKPPVLPAVISHSRNSSDSSGYHEASVLSESPESNGLSSPSGTLPRRSKLTSAAPAPPPSSSLSRSLSNLTSVSSVSNKAAPRSEGMRSCAHSVSTSSLTSSGHGKRKKAAPPPPPVAATLPKTAASEQMQPQRTVSLSTLSSQSSADSYDSSNNASLERNRLAKPASLFRQKIVPVPEEVPKEQPTEKKSAQDMSRESSIDTYSEISSNISSTKSSPERQTKASSLDRPNNKIPENHIAQNKLNQSTPEPEITPSGKLTPEIQQCNNEAKSSSKPVPISPNVEIRNENNKVRMKEDIPEPKPQQLIEKHPADSPSSKVEPAKASLPDVVSDLQMESEEIDRAFQSVTDELEAAILADELKQASPLLEPPSHQTGSQSPSLSEWEYQLPAPPSAFRDRHSPTPTQGETVELAETGVFDESVSIRGPQSAHYEDAKEESAKQSSKMSIPRLDKDRYSSMNGIHERLTENITKVNPLFHAQQLEEEVQTKQNTNEIKKRLSGNTSETKASLNNGRVEIEEDDWKPQQLRSEPEFDVELSNTHSNVTHRSSFNNDANQSNQLTNFTITTYQRPCDTDNIFNDESESGRNVQSEFKKPLQTSVYNRQNGSTNSLATPMSTLPRTNSFNTNDSEYSEHSVVKRSTSHVSLVNTGGRNFRTKSIGNIAMAASREGRKNSESENNIENGHERLRKTTSEVTVSRGSEEISRLGQTPPDQPLQSVQVMRSILNPSGQERVREVSVSEQAPSRVNTLPQPVQNIDNTDFAQPVQKTVVATLEHQPDTTNNNDAAKRYKYQGPPAVNFSTWSERPKSQVSIKVDSDYRIGMGQGGNQEPQPTVQLRSEPRDRLNGSPEEAEPSSHSNLTSSQTEDAKSAMNQTTKIEAAPLSMRIISHTTTSGYNKRTPSFSNQRINFTSKTDDQTQSSTESHQVVVRTSSYNTAQMVDPSRVPIVRAVELKKSFIQGQQPSNGTSVQLNWNEVENQNKRNVSADVNGSLEKEVPETFQGVNNLAKRFSIAAPNTENVRVGFRGTSARPVSAYLYNGTNETLETVDMKRNSTSTSALNNIGTNDSYSGNTTNHGNLNGARKYTSVVGINGAGISTSNFRETEVNRIHPKISNSASIKVNSFAAAKQPMPVVKGFRFATNGANHSDASLVAVSSHKSTTNTEPLTVKVQQSDSYAGQNQRSTFLEPTPTFNVRIQHQPVTKVDSSAIKVKQTTVPVPPPAPAPLRKTVLSRPRSFIASEPNPRDQLMDAIRSFGGGGNLKQTGGS